ncbi:hypothetical protein MASR2M78_01450 [Treponema sp.]
MVYGIAHTTIGETGILAQKSLEAERDRLSSNMEKLHLINQNLEGSINALRSDTDTISVYARELGYADSDERFVRIVGLSSAARRSFTAGNLLVSLRPRAIPDRSLKILSLLIGVFTLIFLKLRQYFRRSPDT